MTGTLGPRNPSRLSIELRLVLWAPLILAAILTAPDPDLFGRLVFAADALRNGLPEIDPYSFTSGDNPWINHEWLAERIFYLTWWLGGIRLLTLLKASVLMGVFFFLVQGAERRGVRPLTARLLALATLPAIAFFSYVIRPGLFTVALTALTCRILQEARERPASLWGLVPVFGLWVNLHGGVVAGMAIFGLWWIAMLLIDRRGQRGNWIRQTILPATASLAVLLVNPYGAELPRFIVWAATMPRPLITEWRSPIDDPYFMGVLLMILAPCAVAWLRTEQRRDGVELVLILAAAGQALLHLRHIPLAAVVLYTFSAGHVDAVVGPLTQRLRGSLGARGWIPEPGPPAVWARIGAWLVGLTIIALSLPHLNCWANPSIPYPLRATRIIRAAGFRGNMITPFNWGEFLINRLAPGVKVSLDARYETVYSPALVDLHGRFFAGTDESLGLIRQYPVDAILLPVDYPVVARLRSDPDWVQVYEGGVAALFVSRERAAEWPRELPPIRRFDCRTLWHGYACFPEPLVLANRHDP